MIPVQCSEGPLAASSQHFCLPSLLPQGSTCRKASNQCCAILLTAHHSTQAINAAGAGLRLSAPGCCFATVVAICRLNRYLQYGIKFWFGTSAVMAVCLSLSADVAAIQAWRPLYLVLTVIIVCSQKVDTTLSKGVLRIAASVLGGTYGVTHFFTLGVNL